MKRFKDDAQRIRKGGARVVWLSGYGNEAAQRAVDVIREAGLSAWRRGDVVWILAADELKVSAIREDWPMWGD